MGKTIVIAEHRLYYLKNIFDRLVYLKDRTIGGIYQNGELNTNMCNKMELRTLYEKDIKGEKDVVEGRVSAKVNNITVYQGKKS